VAATTRSRPGRQRSEAADQAILAATLDVLASDGYGGLTMAAVIARSGVSSATLYRRWTTKQELVAAALASMHPAITPIDTGTLDGDVRELVRAVSTSLSVRRDDINEDVAVALRQSAEFRAAVHEKFVEPRVAVLRQILEQARGRNELGGGLGVEVAMSFVVGPLHHRVYVMDEPLSPAFQRAATTAALATLRALAPPS
jgi:AcrR family transcriptional regulator